ncbi:MAG: helix-turn-helix transcriptional regulator [Thermoplasmata archaeon]|nr:helix-turn-helix transcriptional regulator [Thermoplasmata archaeon]
MADANLKKLGNNVRVLRHQKGLSQEQLAELTGLHRTYIGGIERGERNVSILNLIRLSKALDITVSKMVEGIY